MRAVMISSRADRQSSFVQVRNINAAGGVSLGTFIRQRAAFDHIIDGLRDVSRVVTHALYILGAEQQVDTNADVAWILHHVGEEFAEQRVVHRIDLLIAAPY